MFDKKKIAEAEALGYRIDIMGRNVQVTEPMKDYAIEKISKIERFHPHILDVHVTMDIQKLEHTVTIFIHFSHMKIKVHASSNDMYASIDKATEKLRTQIRRWKDKIQDHHAKSRSVVDMQVNVLQRPYDELEEFNGDIVASNKASEQARSWPPKVIGTSTRPLKDLTKEEAVMKIELSGDQFLIYRDEASRRLHILYRRKDGNYGLIQTE
ncbi:MAG: ribosome-associated translation inhibitor RaiA [Chlamydiae bacterium]|nr:ribosome-associated translation inhibitor RaiA [Chlamydiota bacterium]